MGWALVRRGVGLEPLLAYFSDLQLPCSEGNLGNLSHFVSHLGSHCNQVCTLELATLNQCVDLVGRGGGGEERWRGEGTGATGTYLYFRVVLE